MAQLKKDTERVDFKMLRILYGVLANKLVQWGYKYQRRGKTVPWWGAFAEAIASGIISDDGQNIVFKIPYRKG